MADVRGGSTPIRPTITDFAAMPKFGDRLTVRYMPVTSGGTVPYGTFLELTGTTSMTVDAAEVADNIFGISNGTNVRTNYPREVAQRPMEQADDGSGLVDLVEVLVADDNLTFTMRANADIDLNQVGKAFDFVAVSGEWQIDLAGTTNAQIMIIEKLETRIALCQIASNKRTTGF